MVEHRSVDEALGPLRWNPALEWWEGELVLSSNRSAALLVNSRGGDQRPITGEARDAIARARAMERACREYAAVARRAVSPVEETGPR